MDRLGTHAWRLTGNSSLSVSPAAPEDLVPLAGETRRSSAGYVFQALCVLIPDGHSARRLTVRLTVISHVAFFSK